MAKRQCPSENPRPEQVENLLNAFLSLSDLPSLSLDLSFENLLQSMPAPHDSSDLIDRALKMGSLLLHVANHSSRKRASHHNSLSWPLSHDLTIKVFSMLDTQSLCYASASCSFFSKCAKDPMCYANLDLTTPVPKVNNAVVATMIQRAGKALRSLKLGVVPGATTSPGCCQPLICAVRNAIVDVSNISWIDKRSRQGRDPSSILTRCCLSPLSGDGGAPGALLRKLHLYNIERMDNASLGGALLACPSLLDLEIVGLHVELRQTLMSVSANCHLIERLCFESSKAGRDDSLKAQTCSELVNNCPHLASLSLRGFKLHDCKVRILVKMASTTTTYVPRWRLRLDGELDDRAWRADSSGIRRVYVGDVSFIGMDRDGNIVEVRTVEGGILDMPYPPPRFLRPEVEGVGETPSEPKAGTPAEFVPQDGSDASVTGQRLYGGGARWIHNNLVGPRPRKRRQVVDDEKPKDEPAE
ncbi:F-box protein At4g02733 isoform X2 [Lotus japonicus]|uniref:F-box protein At4g02733 isoform X2 n=1 Tax=Lotus japonicus TaxID=34305 RepID=UPI002590B138|nr:F-box protein At4g02733 isoform X2 [Lotus japonicus]